MRTWIMGSAADGDAHAFPADGAKAFCGFWGEESETFAGALGWAGPFDDLAAASCFARVRTYSYAVSTVGTYNDGTDDYEATVDTTGTVTSVYSDEVELAKAILNYFHWEDIPNAGVIFEGSATQHSVVRKNGSIISDRTEEIFVRLWILDNHDDLLGDVPATYYKPSTEEWHLRVHADCFQSSGYLQLGLASYNAAGDVIDSRTGDIGGAAIQFQVTSDQPGTVLHAFSFSITPTNYWPYRKADGTLPITDAITGAILRSPRSQEF